jgi:formylglycine-generating enzyme required for sulfatase activity
MGAPVGSHPDCVSPEGILDLVGNADEWTADAADAAGGSDARIIRGGGWGDSGEVRGLGWVKVRATADYRKKDIGFRCAADPQPSWLEALWPW